MKYDFLVESYDTERVKVMSVWSEFSDEDMPVRPKRTIRADGASMNTWCTSASAKTRGSAGCLASTSAPLRSRRRKRRLEFIKRYAEDSGKRFAMLRQTDDAWWEAVDDVLRCPTVEGVGHHAPLEAYVPPSRPADGHAAHAGARSAQQLRSHGGHRRPHAEPRPDDLRVYRAEAHCWPGEAQGGAKAPLPGSGGKPVTERPKWTSPEAFSARHMETIVGQSGEQHLKSTQQRFAPLGAAPCGAAG